MRRTNCPSSYLVYFATFLAVCVVVVPFQAKAHDHVLVDGSGVTPETVAAFLKIVRTTDRDFGGRQGSLTAEAVRLPPERADLAICFDEHTAKETIERLEAQRAANSLDFQLEGGSWSSTPGAPRHLTVSFVPDGTLIPGTSLSGPEGASVLFQRMDELFANNGGRDVWVGAMMQSFDRWAALTGTSYNFVSDDGATLSSSSPGSANRGDIRIGMRSIDGQFNIAAVNFFPTNGDMVLDSAELWDSDPLTTFIKLRNAVAHEHGHGLGLRHVCPDVRRMLMEPLLSSQFDGPQQDDIRGVHALYGGSEEPNDANGSARLLTPLGSGFRSPSTLPSTPTNLAPADARRTSIDRAADVDFYELRLTSSRLMTITVTPIGSTYPSGPQTNACTAATSIAGASQANLALEVLRMNAQGSAQSIGTVNLRGVGVAESFNVFLALEGSAPGRFFIKVFSTGTFVGPQLYNLTVSPFFLTPALPPLTGSFGLAPAAATVDVDEPLTQVLAWTVPEGEVWRDLRTLDLRLRHGHTAIWIRWNEADNRISLCDDRGGPGRGRRVDCAAGVEPGSFAVLETPYVRLDLARSRVEGSGPTGRNVTVQLWLSFTSKAAGKTFDVEVAGSDDFGNIDDFVHAGHLTVEKRHKPRNERLAASLEGTEMPFATRLHPNPVDRGSASIMYSIPSIMGGRHVEITVLDVRGRHIRTLASEPKSSGHHHVSWDLRDGGGQIVPAGVFFYRVTVGAQQLTRKLVVVN